MPLSFTFVLPILCKQFPSNIQTDLTLNYTTRNYLMAVARGGLFIAILFSTPVLFHPTRESINILIGYVCGLGRGCGNTLNSVNGDSTSSQGVHKLQVDHKGKRSSWVRHFIIRSYHTQVCLHARRLFGS